MPQAILQKDIIKDLKFLIKENKYSNIVKIDKSRKDKVVYVDYLNTSWKSADKLLNNLQDVYFVRGYANKPIPKFSSTTTSVRVQIGRTPPRPVVNFRSFTRGSNAPTAVFENGSTFILEMVLNKNKVFNSVADIELDDDTYPTLERLFGNYSGSLSKWLHTYFEQQRLMFKKYQSPNWHTFEYGDDDFVKFFSKYIKDYGVYSDFEAGKKLAKYTEWNPSDIYAVKNKAGVQKGLDKIFKIKSKNKGAHLGRLNAYLIRLLENKQLVGISLKQISDNTEAVLKERNTEKTFKDPNIEDKNFTMNDIKFEIDNIHINQTISTYIKFGRSFGITLSSSTSNFGNISYMTSITGASAQGGNAPVAFVNDLLRKKGTNYRFKNDNQEYPRTIEEFLNPKLSAKVKYTQKDYETWFNSIKKYFKKPDKNSRNYDAFMEYITGLYQESYKGAIAAQSKLMALHFFYESLRTYAKDKEFWLRMLYLGMKVGDRFAAHVKIYEKGREEK